MFHVFGEILKAHLGIFLDEPVKRRYAIYLRMEIYNWNMSLIREICKEKVDINSVNEERFFNYMLK